MKPAENRSEAVEKRLVALGVFKIQEFFRDGPRLRMACVLEIKAGSELEVQRPQGFSVPSITELEKELPALINAASAGFAKPVVTELTFED